MSHSCSKRRPSSVSFDHHGKAYKLRTLNSEIYMPSNSNRWRNEEKAKGTMEL